MERCNTLAAAYAARFSAGNRAAGGVVREEARAESGSVTRETPPPARGRLDEAVLLDVLRRSAGPCDRVFASRIAHCIGAQSVL